MSLWMICPCMGADTEERAIVMIFDFEKRRHGYLCGFGLPQGWTIAVRARDAHSTSTGEQADLIAQQYLASVDPPAAAVGVPFLEHAVGLPRMLN